MLVRVERPVYHAGWRAGKSVKRQTVDLSGYPDLVAMYLGMRVDSPRGLLTTLRFIRRIRKAVHARPEGLLLHEPLVFPPRTFGMRQYWRDFDALERWARAEPHRTWWIEYLRDTKGTGFWHETYFMGGGFEAIYDNVHEPTGLLTFAPPEQPMGGMFTARRRLRLAEAHDAAPPPAAPSEADVSEP